MKPDEDETMISSVSVFCGSSAGTNGMYIAAAKELGALLAERNITLVYGGGSLGLMGALASAVKERGGKAIGVITQQLVDKEVAHRGLDELHIVRTMHQRKEMMGRLGQAFIALPGGIGTLEELLEAMAWKKLRIHDKPLGLLNTAGYYDGFIEFLRQSVEHGFLEQQHFELLTIETDARRLVDKFLRRVPA